MKTRPFYRQFLPVFLLAVLFFYSCSQNTILDETTTLPETPKNVMVKPGNKRLIVSWEVVSGAGSYELLWGEDFAEGGAETARELSTTTAELGELENGKEYWVKVRSKNNAGVSGFSSPVEGTPAVQVPAPSVIRGNGSLSAGWPAETGVDYELWYGTDDNTGSAVKWTGTITVTGSAAGTVITGLADTNTYYVWLKAKAQEDTVFSDFGPGTRGSPQGPPASTPESFVYVPGGIVVGNETYAILVTVPLSPPGYMNAGKTLSKKGVFVEGRTVEIESFFMAKYETTWRLWYDVQSWAETNDYSFQNKISEPNETNENYPVSGISWRDVIIWCNAYSEMSGFEPVYYYQGTVLKDSRNANGSACDGALMDTDKNGYRLPTEAEREYAARGGDPGKADWMFLYAGSDDADDVAWHHGNSAYQVKDVGGKSANRLSIYDLSGNVQEWGWDWMNYGIAVTPSTPAEGELYSGRFNQKPMEGGGVGSNITMACVADRWSFSTNYTDPYVGFRLVRKAE